MTERINIKWIPAVSGDDSRTHRDEVRAHVNIKKCPGYHMLEAGGWEVCECPPGLAKKTCDWLCEHPSIEVAEPEGFGEAMMFAAAEPEFGRATEVEAFNEWYQTFVKLGAAHTKTRGEGVTIAVFDNGIQDGHSWNSYEGVPRIAEQKLFRLTESDLGGGGHGQPVTGLEFAIGPGLLCTNYKAASAADARMSWTDASNAFLYAKAQGHKIFNLSYGGGSSLLLVDTMRICKEAGIAIFVAAGNAGGSTQFPANNKNAYAVSALDQNGVIAGFSDRGKIDCAAPGTSLLTSNNSGGFSHFSGTSGACPIASAICGLVLSQHPEWTGVQCAEHMLAKARKQLPTTSYGQGVVDAGAATGATEPVGIDTELPGAPQNLRATDVVVGDAVQAPGFVLRWDASSDNVGIKAYEIFGGDFRFETVGGDQTSLKINRALGTGSRLRVRAVDISDNVSPLSEFLDETGSVPVPDPEPTPEPEPQPDPVPEPVPEPDPGPVPEPEPTPQPIPPAEGPMNLTKLAVIQSSFPAYEAVGEGLDKLTDGDPRTKTLHFNKESSYILDFQQDVFCDLVALTSANDYPQRDPQIVRIYSDEGSFNWVLRHEWINVVFSKRWERQEFNPVALSATARRWKIQCISSGQASPGDKGTGMLQIGELEFWGSWAHANPVPIPTPLPGPEPIPVTLSQADMDALESLRTNQRTDGQKQLLKGELELLLASLS